MRVLLVGPSHDPLNFSLRQFQQRSLIFETEKSFPPWQAQANWIKALEDLGNEVKTFLYTEHLLSPLVDRCFNHQANHQKIIMKLINRMADKPWDSEFRSYRLKKTAQLFKPDIFLISGGPGLKLLKTSTWFWLKREYPRARFVLLNGMKPDYPETIYERNVLPIIDVVMTNDETFAKTWKMWGAKEILMPISAIDLEMATIPAYLGPSVAPSDVCFIGSLEPIRHYEERLEYLNSLVHLNLAIYSPHYRALKKIPELQKKYRGVATGNQQFAVYRATKIALNIQGRHYMPQGANLRMFEIAATGTLQLIDNLMPGIFEIGNEIMTFDNAKDMQEKVHYFLAHEDERKKIGEAAVRKTFAFHTYKERFASLLKKLGCGHQDN